MSGDAALSTPPSRRFVRVEILRSLVRGSRSTGRESVWPPEAERQVALDDPGAADVY